MYHTAELVIWVFRGCSTLKSRLIVLNAMWLVGRLSIRSKFFTVQLTYFVATKFDAFQCFIVDRLAPLFYILSVKDELIRVFGVFFDGFRINKLPRCFSVSFWNGNIHQVVRMFFISWNFKACCKCVGIYRKGLLLLSEEPARDRWQAIASARINDLPVFSNLCLDCLLQHKIHRNLVANDFFLFGHLWFVHVAGYLRLLV